MAILKPESLGIIDFISPRDDSIDTDLNPETGEPFSDIEKYKETYDFKKHCKIKDGLQPTIFKINFSVNAKKQMLIDNSSLGGDGKKEEFGFKLGNHKQAIVRCVLCDIVNPDYVPLAQRLVFKKDKDGLVSTETMDELMKCGILDEIYSFYLQNKENLETLKKK